MAVGLAAVGRHFGKQNGNVWSNISISGSKSSPFGRLEPFMEAKCHEMTKEKYSGKQNGFISSNISILLPKPESFGKTVFSGKQNENIWPNISILGSKTLLFDQKSTSWKANSEDLAKYLYLRKPKLPIYQRVARFDGF